MKQNIGKNLNVGFLEIKRDNYVYELFFDDVELYEKARKISDLLEK